MKTPHFQILLLVIACLTNVANGLLRNISIRKNIYVTRRMSTLDAIKNDLAIVLLAGGKGKRMKSDIPKQFMPLLGRPVFLHSLDIFLNLEIVHSIVIIMDESYRQEFEYLREKDSRIIWADPGKERQDSVYNGILKVPKDCKIVAVHDSARPLVTQEEVLQVIKDGREFGAAVLGVPMKATVKESIDGSFVTRTIPRSTLWEIHTPQVVSLEAILRGFDKVNTEKIEVTDDVSIIEALGEPVKLTLGEYTNIKLTTPDDFAVAEQVLTERAEKKKKNKDLSPPSPVAVSSSTTSLPCSTEEYRKSLERRK